MLMQMKIKYIKICLCAGFCFAIGWIVGLICKDLRWFLYENTFNLFELLYFISTSGIALYIAHRIEKGIQDTRNQKDLLIKKIDEIDQEINDLWRSIQRVGNHYEIDLSLMVSQLKMLNIHIRRTHNAIEHFYPTAYKEQHLKSLSVRNLRMLTTYTQRGMTDLISCSAGRLHYDEERCAEIRTEISKMRDICFDDVLELNMM